MSHYGSDPDPVSVEPTTEGVTEALDTLQSAGDSDQNDQDFGDGFAKQRKNIDF